MKKNEMFINWFSIMQTKPGFNLDEMSKKEVFEAAIDFYKNIETSKKQVKAMRKNCSIVIEDFIDTSLDYHRAFMSGVYYDDDKRVVTNGNYLIMLSGLPVDSSKNKMTWDGLIQKDGRFPNYQKVLPNWEIMEKSTAFTLDDINIVNKSISTKSHNKLKNDVSCSFNDVKLSGLIIRMAAKFWNIYPDAELYRRKETTFESGCSVHNDYFCLKSGDNMFIFMAFVPDFKTTLVYDNKTKLVA